MLRWELLWDAPKLTGQRSGESGILTGRFGTSEQLKEGELVKPRDNVLLVHRRRYKGMGLTQKHFWKCFYWK